MLVDCDGPVIDAVAELRRLGPVLSKVDIIVCRCGMRLCPSCKLAVRSPATAGQGMAMTERMRLNQFDHEFAARTTTQDWQRILLLRDHPRMLDGVLSYDALIPDYFANNVILNRVVIELRRFQLLVYTLHLHDTRRPDDPRTGLTHSRLQKLAVTHELASPGGVTTFMGLMLLAGYLKRTRSIEDKRIVHYQPTEKFVAIVEGWNSTILACIDAIEPEGRLVECHAGHPRFGWDMRERGAQVLLAGWKPLNPFPEAEHFISRQGGFMLLLRIVAENIRHGARRNIVPVSVDLATFGKRFGVSRSQLRQLLESGYAQGLLEAAPKNGTHILASPRLIASFVGWQASELAYYREWALAVKASLGLTGVGDAGVRIGLDLAAHSSD
jgi:DNA-binding MarR family transcriptional regulator